VEFDTANKHLVGLKGDQVVVMVPPRAPLSREEAMMLAAWLLAISGIDLETFRQAFDAVSNA
jgi:hypothetical protein